MKKETNIWKVLGIISMSINAVFILLLLIGTAAINEEIELEAKCETQCSSIPGSQMGYMEAGICYCLDDDFEIVDYFEDISS